jgi:NlpC/P60 family putative phage cell wall peptidase
MAGDAVESAGSTGVVALARGWLGTPYCHRASTKGAGCDCLGLVLAIWRDLRGGEPATVPHYEAGWAEVDRDERLWTALRRHLTELPGGSDLTPGQVILFRMRDRAAARHLGVLSQIGQDGVARFIHAYEPHGVIESPLSAPWRRRIAARFELI